MQPVVSVMSNFGFKIDPFEHLDSTKDTHLQEYLVIPKEVEIALSDQTVAIFARPGGGKSAVRIYAARFYGESRGVKFPITYVPETYTTGPDLHFEGIKRVIARSIFIYLVSYPDLFFTLSAKTRKKIEQALLELPYGLDFNLNVLIEARFIADLEQLLGVSALSGIQRLDQTHKRLALELRKELRYSKFHDNG